MPGSRYCWKLSSTCSILIIQSGSLVLCHRPVRDHCHNFGKRTISSALEQGCWGGGSGYVGDAGYRGNNIDYFGIAAKLCRLNCCWLLWLLLWAVLDFANPHFPLPPFSFPSPLSMPLALYLPLPFSLIQFPPSYSRCSLIWSAFWFCWQNDELFQLSLNDNWQLVNCRTDSQTDR